LRDARKLKLVPSVTTVIKCAAKPGLELWKTKQAILSALTLPKVAGEAEDAYLARILSDSQEQARKASERGTAIHAAIQGSFEDETIPEGMWPYAKGVMVELFSECGWGVWKPELSFAHPYGFGGKCDLASKEWIVDFKTKEFSKDEVNSLKTWEEHAMQLAAYRTGLGLVDARCGIVYVSVTEPGLVKAIEIDEEDLQRGWNCFRSLLQYWQSANRYQSAFE
jgi:hypothetical protein